jgi:hypothetical protein
MITITETELSGITDYKNNLPLAKNTKGKKYKKHSIHD